MKKVSSFPALEKKRERGAMQVMDAATTQAEATSPSPLAKRQQTNEERVAEEARVNRAMRTACCAGKVDKALEMLRLGAELNGYTNPSSKLSTSGPLHYASLYGRRLIVEMLIDQGVRVEALGNDEETGLNLAAYTDHLDVCALFIKHGLDPAVEGRTGMSALNSYGHLAYPRLAPEVVAERVKVLKEMRVQYLKDQERTARRNETWTRRWPYMNFLTGCKIRPMLAEHLEAALKVDTTAELPPIDRSTPEANHAYLMNAVFGDEALSRRVAELL